MSPESGSRQPVTVVQPPEYLFESENAPALVEAFRDGWAAAIAATDAAESEAVSRFAEALRTAVKPWTPGAMPTDVLLSEIERLSQAPADTGEGA